MITNSQRHSDERTRTRLLNRLGYFKTPGGGTAGLSSSELSSVISQSTISCTNFSFPLANHHPDNSQNLTLLGDAAPVMVNLNDNLNEGDCRHDDDVPYFKSSSPTSCMIDISSTIRSSSTSHQSYNKSQRRNYRPPEPPPTDITAITTATYNSTSVQFNEKAAVLLIPSRYQYSDRIKKCMWSSKQEMTEMTKRNATEFAAEGWDWKNVVMERDMHFDKVTGTLVHPCHLNNKRLYMLYDEIDRDAYDKDDYQAYDCEQEYCFQPLERKSHVMARGNMTR